MKQSNKHQQIVNVKNIAPLQENKMPRSTCKVGIFEEVIKGTDGNIRRAVFRVPFRVPL